MSASNRIIPYGRHFIDDADIQAVVDVLRSDWLTCGPEVTRFEDAVSSYIGVKHAIAVSNGTAALHLCCMALDVKSGDVGVTSPLTFLASANCLAYCGARPDFVDIDSDSYCLSSQRLEEYIRLNGVPKVVIPVDFAGVPADLPRIYDMAKQYGFSVIEDAAHSIGSSYTCEGKTFRCGACIHSDLAIFSFHPVKTVTTGEGGMILTNNDALARRVRMLCSHGMERNSDLFQPWPINNRDGRMLKEGEGEPGYCPTKKPSWLYQQQMLGYNYRITDIQCALGSSQFRRIDEIIKRRRDIVKYYRTAFLKNNKLICPPCPPDADPAYHLFVLRFSGGGTRREEAFAALREQGIFTQIHYIPVYLQPWYQQQYGYAAGKCPEAEAVYENCLSIPLYPSMTDADVKKVVDAIEAFTGS